MNQDLLDRVKKKEKPQRVQIHINARKELYSSFRDACKSRQNDLFVQDVFEAFMEWFVEQNK